MNRNDYIAGTTYPEELLDSRLTIEGNVIGCIYTDTTLIKEYDLKSTDFITNDGRMLFNIVNQMRMHDFKDNIDDVAIMTAPFLSDEIKNKFDFEQVQNIIDTVNNDHAEQYINTLLKANTVLKLYNTGFNVLKEIPLNKNRNVIPLSYFNNNCNTPEQVLEFYETILSKMQGNNRTNVISDNIVCFDKSYIESMSTDKYKGISFAKAGKDNNNKDISVLPYLSNSLGGYLKGTLNMIAGYSGTGKTTIYINIIMSLLSQGKKVLIISNEQAEKIFYDAIISWIIKKTTTYNLNKNKLKDISTQTETDKQMIKDAMKYFQDNYKDRLRVIHIADASMNTVTALIRKYVQKGFDTVLYDTFKYDTTSTEKEIYMSLIKDSRKLDELAKKYNIIVLSSLQLAESTRGELFLDASTLSQSKQIKEVLETLVLMRTVYPEELNPTHKFYCNPYTEKKVNEEYVKEEYKADDEAIYRMLFIEKSRSGKNSSDTGIAYLLKFFGNTGTFKEVAYCRPVHANIKFKK